MQVPVDDVEGKKKPSMFPIIALIVVVIVLSAGFGFYYLQASSQIANLNGKLSTANNNLTTANNSISSDQHQISVLSSNISSLQSTVSSDVQSIVSLQGTVRSDNSTINSLNTKVLSLNENVSNLSGNLEAEKSQAATLDTQISQLQSNETSAIQQITELKTQVGTDNSSISSLQTQVNSLTGITSMSENTVELSSKQITVPNAQFLSVVNFTASYPGYIVITSTSTGSSSFGEVADQITAKEYSVTTGMFTYSYSTTAIILPVGPGQIYVYYGDTAGSQTTLNVTYYY